LWPAIREFWQDSGFLIDRELPDIGIMETDWAENRAKIPDSTLRKVIGKVLDQAYSYPERDKFRTRLEHGEDPAPPKSTSAIAARTRSWSASARANR